jgi:DNA-binding transcriptional regulator LsrR (DeoR family)
LAACPPSTAPAPSRASSMREAEAGGMKRADIARELDITRQQITKLIGARQAPAGR